MKREELLDYTYFVVKHIERGITPAWLVDKYLSLPPAEGATAEEILKRHLYGYQWYASICDERVFKAMHEFAAQRQPQPTAEGMADKKLKEILGDRLCDFCPLEKKGVYGVPGGFMAGCEGSRCTEALDEAIQKLAAQPQPTSEGAEDISAASYIRNTWGEAWLRNMWEAGDVIGALEEFAALISEGYVPKDQHDLIVNAADKLLLENRQLKEEVEYYNKLLR